MRQNKLCQYGFFSLSSEYGPSDSSDGPYVHFISNYRIIAKLNPAHIT